MAGFFICFSDLCDCQPAVFDELTAGSAFTSSISEWAAEQLIDVLGQCLQLVRGHLRDGVHGAVFIAHEIQLACRQRHTF